MHFVLFDWGVSQSAIALYIYIELAILAFILPTSGHANFECQHSPNLITCYKPTSPSKTDPHKMETAHRSWLQLLMKT